MFTWPIQDDLMNKTKICEHDRKIHNNEHTHGEYDRNILRFIVVKNNIFFLPRDGPPQPQGWTYVGLKIFWSKSNRNLVILIWSSELASLLSQALTYNFFRHRQNVQLNAMILLLYFINFTIFKLLHSILST